MEQVSAGALTNVGKFIKKAYKGLFDGLDKLAKLGYQVSNAQKADDGTLTYDIATSDSTVKVKAVPITDRFDVEFTFEDGKTVSKQSVKQEQFDKVFTDVVEGELNQGIEEYQRTTSEPQQSTESSRQLSATFKKVTSADSIDIELIGIKANYNAVDALSTIKNIVDSDDFCESLVLDTPQTFVITETDDDYLVEDTNTAIETYTEDILGELYIALFNFQNIHWTAKGEDFFTLHEKLDEYIEKLREDIDTFGELAVEVEGKINNPIDIIAKHETTSIDCLSELNCHIDGFSVDDGFAYVRACIERFCSFIDLYRCNYSLDIQSEIDSIVRYWRKEADYKLKRQAM